MIFRYSMIVLLFMSVLFLTSKSIFAESVRFATVDFTPYALPDDPDGRLGLIVDINAIIASRAGITITDSVFPIARVVKNLEHGVSDCTTLLLTPWSKMKLRPVAEVLDRFDSVIVTRTGLSITRIEDLRGRRLALPRGSFKDLPISTVPYIQRVPTNGYEQSARLLKAGRVDAIAGTELSIFHYLSVEKMSRKDIGGVLTFERSPIWLQCAKGQLSEEMLSKLHQATNSLRKEGVFDNLVERYISEEFN